MLQKFVKWLKGMQFAKLMCAILTATAIGLFVWGFFVPPLGAIDGSVLKAGGILLGFAALWVAGHVIVEMETKASFKHGETEIVVENDKEK